MTLHRGRLQAEYYPRYRPMRRGGALLPVWLAGRAGARPDHPILGHRACSTFEADCIPFLIRSLVAKCYVWILNGAWSSRGRTCDGPSSPKSLLAQRWRGRLPRKRSSPLPANGASECWHRRSARSQSEKGCANWAMSKAKTFLSSGGSMTEWTGLPRSRSNWSDSSRTLSPPMEHRRRELPNRPRKAFRWFRSVMDWWKALLILGAILPD